MSSSKSFTSRLSNNLASYNPLKRRTLSVLPKRKSLVVKNTLNLRKNLLKKNKIKNKNIKILINIDIQN